MFIEYLKISTWYGNSLDPGLYYILMLVLMMIFYTQKIDKMK